MTMASPRWTAALLLTLGVFIGLSSASVKLCDEPRVDPCLPGGHWDALLQECTGYSGRACFDTYAGAHCSERNLSAPVISMGGEPVIFQEFWEQKLGAPCTSTSSNYRTAYQRGLNGGLILPPLDDAIRKLHALVGNARTEGYTIIPSYGSTQAVHAAMYALAATRPFAWQDVLVQTPYYFMYGPWAETTVAVGTEGSEHRLRFNTQADPDANSTIEIVTYPNNPDGVLRTPRVTDPARTIHDCVYAWPQFTNITEPMNFPLMTFSSSKQSGHAGTRFGWALVRDPDVAKAMESYIVQQTLGVSVDGQLRVLDILSTIIEEEEAQRAGKIPESKSFLSWARNKMNARFARLIDLFENHNPHNFILVNRATRGAYAWIQCPEDLDCAAVFATQNIESEPGTGFGASTMFTRLTLMMRDVELAVLFERLQRLLLGPLPKPEQLPELLVEPPERRPGC